MTLANRPYHQAEQFLATEPRFRRLIETIGPCTLQPNPDLFAVLVRCVISQQISTRAADSIAARLKDWCGADGITPTRLRSATDEELRSCGLSAPKRRTLRALSEHPATSADALTALTLVSNEEIAARLLPITGIGPWTVQMVLMFGLGRLDVWPTGDLGLRMAVRDQWELADTPSSAEVERLGAAWKPYRTVATWYLWRSRGSVPQSGDGDSGNAELKPAKILEVSSSRMRSKGIVRGSRDAKRPGV